MMKDSGKIQKEGFKFGAKFGAIFGKKSGKSEIKHFLKRFTVFLEFWDILLKENVLPPEISGSNKN